MIAAAQSPSGESSLPFLNGLVARPADPDYCENMVKAKSDDPFASNDPAVYISPATSRILKQRIKSADEGRLVWSEKVLQRIRQWFSKSSTTETR
ncbi:MAG TPA: hypothetical protein VGR73_07765 [Bryobacteraceae bacterium]|nr:hypothetical protein [Bryobacteraceae bacterium]